jgi:hypothetical protein
MNGSVGPVTTVDDTADASRFVRFMDLANAVPEYGDVRRSGVRHGRERGAGGGVEFIREDTLTAAVEQWWRPVEVAAEDGLFFAGLTGYVLGATPVVG